MVFKNFLEFLPNCPEFSSKFFLLFFIDKKFCNIFCRIDFIQKNGGEHILGSECDQKILSKKESNGYVFSPNYPFPYIPKTVCRYFIYGMQDAQNLEIVKLEFLMFDIPKAEKAEKDE